MTAIVNILKTGGIAKNMALPAYMRAVIKNTIISIKNLPDLAMRQVFL